MAPTTQTFQIEKGYRMLRRRVITRRGVLWLGQTCNLRCHFCYFLDRINDKEHPEHPFMSLDKAKRICSTLVDHYGNNAIDIQGGEPTIYPHIFELTQHCREIGLLPTLITNAIPLSNARNCDRLKQAGIRDLLISIQGIGDTYNRIVGVDQAFSKQMRGLENVANVGIPIRFNCVLSKPALPQLEQIVDLAVEFGARVVNFLTFNPFEDQQLEGKRSALNVPRYREVGAFLNPAMDRLAEAGIECNVRYFPICMVAPRHRKSIYNFQQLPYDLHEWDYASWSWTAQQPQRLRAGDPSPLEDIARSTYDPAAFPRPFRALAGMAGDLVRQNPRLRPPAEAVHRVVDKILSPSSSFVSEDERKDRLYQANGRMRASIQGRYRYAHVCAVCAARSICDGFHGDYAQFFGTAEACPIVDQAAIRDPRHFIRHQDKLVELEDVEWAA
jgi:MoaA/NifB/PqqE/SkfB family radical SAM enzyme